MSDEKERWFVVNNAGLAHMAESEAGAVRLASVNDRLYPKFAPHRAVRLIDAAEVEALRAEVDARIAAAVAAERERCATVAEQATASTAFQSVEHYKLASAIAHAIREPKP